MKKPKTILNWMLSASLIFLASCSKDDHESSSTEAVASTKYIVALQGNSVDGAEEVDYLLEYSDLSSLTSGTISAEGQGIEQLGWRYFYSVNNTVFSAGYYDDDKCTAYKLDDYGDLVEKSNFTFSSTLNAFSDLDGETMLGVELSYGGYDDKTFYIVDADSGLVTDIKYSAIDTQIGDGTESDPGATPWVTGMILRDGKLYVSYHKWDGIFYYTTPDTDRAYVAVFSYPDFELEKIIEDDRTSPIGINGHSSGIIKTEDDDIYSYSSSSLSSGFTSATKPSGVLKIADGETEFDEDYFFDVENATNGGKIFWMDYVGDGKALARIIVDDTNGIYAWGAFLNNEVVRLVVLDLENKTVTSVSGIDNHYSRYVSKLYVEDGLAYLGATEGAEGAEETSIFVVDVTTATATKGATVDGTSIKGIFKISN
jgi:hypothetical protein